MSLKRSMRPGFAGIDNDLLFTTRPRCSSATPRTRSPSWWRRSRTRSRRPRPSQPRLGEDPERRWRRRRVSPPPRISLPGLLRAQGTKARRSPLNPTWPPHPGLCRRVLEDPTPSPPRAPCPSTVGSSPAPPPAPPSPPPAATSAPGSPPPPRPPLHSPHTPLPAVSLRRPPQLGEDHDPLTGGPGREHHHLDRALVDHVGGVVDDHHVPVGQIADGLSGLPALPDQVDLQALAGQVLGARRGPRHGSRPRTRPSAPPRRPPHWSRSRSGGRSGGPRSAA